MILYSGYMSKYGASIHWNSELKGYPCLPHGLNGIFIAGPAKIGKNCIIFHQVTIGANTLPYSKGVGAPSIGDNCYIGAGAKIIGNVKIGNNVRIGANCVVYKDVPDNSVVLSGNQVNITREEPPLNRFHAFNGKKWIYYDDGNWKEETDAQIMASLQFSLISYKR